MPSRKPASKKPKNPQVAARVPDEILVEIKVLATRQHRKLQALVSEALSDLLVKYGQRESRD